MIEAELYVNTEDAKHVTVIITLNKKEYRITNRFWVEVARWLGAIFITFMYPIHFILYPFGVRLIKWTKQEEEK